MGTLYRSSFGAAMHCAGPSLCAPGAQSFGYSANSALNFDTGVPHVSDRSDHCTRADSAESVYQSMSAVQKIGDGLVDSVLGDNIPVLTEQEKFNETVTSSVKRLEAAITGGIRYFVSLNAVLTKQRL